MHASNTHAVMSSQIRSAIAVCRTYLRVIKLPYCFAVTPLKTAFVMATVIVYY